MIHFTDNLMDSNVGRDQSKLVMQKLVYLTNVAVIVIFMMC